MEIRKSFEIEMGHVVRNCSTDRCRFSIHGHSAKIEVFFKAKKLDNAGMIMDFGLMKHAIKQFIDSFDHAYVVWEKDDEKFKEFHKQYNRRWIETPFNPTAEILALYFCYMVNEIIKHTEFNNGEDESLICSKVTYHETRTGSATATFEDLQDIDLYDGSYKVSFSSYIQNDWSSDLIHFINEMGTVHPQKIYFINPIIKQQVR